MINLETLYKVSYGLYVVCSGDKERGNGFISNTVFQVTAEPPQFAICCNKKNYTVEFIKKCGAFSVSVLDKDSSPEIIGLFGYKTGKDFDKLAGMNIKYGETGVPVLINDCLAYFECKVVNTIDAGTHLIIIGELINTAIIDDSKEPLTYLYYRQVRKGVAPKNAPTYISKSNTENIISDLLSKKYKCPTCGYIYDEAIEKVKFEDLPGNWICPICGSEKSEFFEI